VTRCNGLDFRKQKQHVQRKVGKEANEEPVLVVKYCPEQKNIHGEDEEYKGKPRREG
jgi:hypothetical protein